MLKAGSLFIVLQVVSGADKECSKSIDSKGQQGVDFQCFAEVVVLHYQTQKELPCELIIEARAENITAEKLRAAFDRIQFREAKIWLNDQTVQALPEKAIIKDGASSYIYVANDQTEEEELKFEQIMVIPSTTDKGFTSVKLIDSIPDGMRIVTEGAYYVYAQSKAGELEHEH